MDFLTSASPILYSVKLLTMCGLICDCLTFRRLSNSHTTLCLWKLATDNIRGPDIVSRAWHKHHVLMQMKAFLGTMLSLVPRKEKLNTKCQHRMKHQCQVIRNSKRICPAEGKTFWTPVSTLTTCSRLPELMSSTMTMSQKKSQGTTDQWQNGCWSLEFRAITSYNKPKFHCTLDEDPLTSLYDQVSKVEQNVNRKLRLITCKQNVRSFLSAFIMYFKVINFWQKAFYKVWVSKSHDPIFY